MYRELRDEELVQMARNGDEDAGTELLERYKPVVRQKAACYYMIGADNEDLIQEGMIGAFKAIQSYDPEKGAGFATFANMCIKRQLITAVKSAACKKHSPLNSSVSLSNPVPEDDGHSTLEETIEGSGSMDPEQQILMEEELKLIENDGQAQFTDLERAVWILHLEGCSYSEIAQRLNRTNKAVDNAIRRAKNKLAAMLKA